MFRGLGPPMKFEVLKYITPKLTAIWEIIFISESWIEHLTPTDYLNPNKLNTKFQIPYCGSMFLAMSSFLILSPLSSSAHYNRVLLSLFPQDPVDSLLFLELTKPPFQSFWEWLISSCLSCDSLPTSFRSLRIYHHLKDGFLNTPFILILSPP